MLPDSLPRHPTNPTLLPRPHTPRRGPQDWFESMKTKLWIFPRGMARDGGVGEASLFSLPHGGDGRGGKGGLETKYTALAGKTV